MLTAGIDRTGGAIRLLELPDPRPPRAGEVLLDGAREWVTGTRSSGPAAGIPVRSPRWRSVSRPPGWWPRSGNPS